MGTVNFKLTSQSNRKVIIISDNSLNVWGTAGFGLSDFAAGNAGNNKVLVKLLIETKDATIEKEINLTMEGAFGTVASPITNAANLIYNFAIDDKGSIVYISNVTNLPSTYGTFPDGIYTITYTLSNLQPVSTTTSSVMAEHAEQLVIERAHNIADKYIIGEPFDPFMLANLLMTEALMFAVTKASIVGRKDTIIDLLTVIGNNDDRQYNFKF